MANNRIETASEILDFFYSLISFTYGEERALNLMNIAEAMLRRERDWEMLKVLDTSTTASSGDTYLSMKTLPTNPAFDRSVGKLYVGTVLYTQIPFEQRILYRDHPHRFYIDIRNSQFALTGTQGASATINLPYLYRPFPLVKSGAVAGTSISSPEWIPADLRAVLAFKMAHVLQANIESDEVAHRMSQNQLAEMNMLLDALRDWDAQLKLNAMGGQVGYDAAVADDISPLGYLKLGDF